MFDIIIPTTNLHLSDDCLVSILENVSSGTAFRVLLIDNSEEGAESAHISYPPEVVRVQLPPKVGWVKAANVGLALSDAPFVVLMNDDTLVRTPDWLMILRAPFRSVPALAAIGPRTTTNCYQGRLPEDYTGPYVLPKTKVEPQKPGGIGAFKLSFFCVMFTRESLENVGLLDIRLNNGYGGDDDDWQARAELAGLRLGVHADVLVEHRGTQSYGENRAKLNPQNLRALKQKWQEILK